MAKWGEEEIIGALVMRVMRKEKRCVVRAWTVKGRYRGNGVGRGLLEEGVRVAMGKGCVVAGGWQDKEKETGAGGMEFDEGHVSMCCPSSSVDPFLEMGFGELTGGQMRRRYFRKCLIVGLRGGRGERGRFWPRWWPSRWLWGGDGWIILVQWIQGWGRQGGGVYTPAWILMLRYDDIDEMIECTKL